MKIYGDINMQQNELQQAVLQVETNFPSAPIPGRLVFKDRILYICIEINSGTPVWVPLTAEIGSYEYVQSVSASEWIITHDLTTTIPSVQVYGADNKNLFPDDIEVLSSDTVKITFSAPLTGRAVILAGPKSGNKPAAYSFDYTQTSPSDTWVIDHNLGHSPIIRIFVGNQEIQPISISHDSLFTTTVTFGAAVVGQARLI